MYAAIKSIKPVVGEGTNYYQFDVTIALEGERTKSFTVPAQDFFDFQKMRANVAHWTGCLLAVKESEWEDVLDTKLEEPAAFPDGSAVLRDICAMTSEELEEEMEELQAAIGDDSEMGE